ncbi:helix-turn-helix domain-containing protein [Candidatus Synchoanobacter obligatus]|uniref:Helix-turn-helix domain-containing protein n=1 Tax=Candidatus Synchoanobacter obligatus TaxID=2919597 RepID=A0ABT1L4R4_9GAMM|nr:helix-turn-helix domain-containing protein [Candidatus Synchoanobacter obligatus]MCP8351858.1 helix-turn-helix domain-containing protein [Candidatus Synchoanobacter obligatus]
MAKNNTPVGQELAHTRDLLSLSVQEVMSILKMKESTIQMLEKDLYPSQNIDVFTKAHLVSYCKVLNINAQTMINKLEAKGYNFPSAKTVKEQPELSKSYGRKKQTIALGIFIIYMGMYLMSKPAETVEHTIASPLTSEVLYE